MKFLNKFLKVRKYICTGLAACMMMGMTACGNVAYEMPYDADGSVSGFNILTSTDSGTAASFAEKLCVVTGNVLLEDVNMENATSALLCDVNNQTVLYSKNPHERLYPASLTKVMTALVALKYGQMDQTLTATGAVNITESGAQLMGLKEGDSMTLNQALHILLMYSANDVAMMIAENIGGTVEGFVEMMNEEAKEIGATNSNFVNPHGLTDDNHYTTAYDMYLIFNEAIKYEKFTEIIQMTSYTTSYYNRRGEAQEISVNTTNRFLKGTAELPTNVTVIGGKTGVTNAAKHCLVVLSKDTNGAPYISVILRSETNDEIYAQMTELLNKINK